MKYVITWALCSFLVLGCQANKEAEQPIQKENTPQQVTKKKELPILKVGLSAEPTSMDPHYHDAGYNKPFMQHLYQGLTSMNALLQLEPSLATKWEVVEPTVWRFYLRKGVKFHDGSDFDAQDVVYSIARIPHVPNSPGPFTSNIRSIKDIKIIDDHTIDITTSVPYPILPNDLSTVMIIPSLDDSVTYVNGQASDSQWPETKDFNSGKLAIGTGPFRLKEYRAGDLIALERFDGYWGEKAQVKGIDFYPMPDNGARSSALLSGQVDLIENVPANDLERINADEKLHIISGASTVAIFFAFDQHGSPTPKVNNGQGKNPFLDKRVREAFNLAVDKRAIIRDIKDGLAEEMPSMVPPSIFGSTDKVKFVDYDLERARQLMREAGWADGFSLVLNAPSDRYADGVQVTQAVAQMLAKLNIDVSVETFPRSIYFSKASNYEYSLYMGATASDNGDASYTLKVMAHTRDMEHGWGGGNRGRYSNAEVDKLIEMALKEMDPEQRRTYYQKALEMFHGDYPFIPLYFQVGLWAAKKGVEFTPRMDQGTVLNQVRVS